VRNSSVRSLKQPRQLHADRTHQLLQRRETSRIYLCPFQILCLSCAVHASRSPCPGAGSLCHAAAVPRMSAAAQLGPCCLPARRLLWEGRAVRKKKSHSSWLTPALLNINSNSLSLLSEPSPPCDPACPVALPACTEQ